MGKKFSWRAFISFGLTYSFIIILFSGIILYVSPPGRYAHWVMWKLLGFTKEGWSAIHTVFSYTFVILSFFHLFTINWKAFLSYLKIKKQSGLNKKKEFIFSSVLTLVFFFGIIFSVPPFQTIMDWGEQFTGSWEGTDDVAPVPHAELLTLAELSVQLDLTSVNEITSKLQTHNIIFENTGEQTLKEIAGVNKTTPIEIYEIIAKKPGNQRQGSGIGRKTLEDFALELNISINEVMAILEENDITAEKNQTLRTIGEENDLPPRDIYEMFTKDL